MPNTSTYLKRNVLLQIAILSILLAAFFTLDTYAQTTQLYWTDNLGLHRIVVGENEPETILESVLHTPNSISIDSEAGMMYWTDSVLGTLRQANLDGSDIKTVVSGRVNPGKAALDVQAGKVYWTDSTPGVIQRANLDGSGIEDLITEGMNFPSDIALDTLAGKMYWTNLVSGIIRRANLDGTGVEDVINPSPNRAQHLALDLKAGTLYWSDGSRIYRTNLDGSDAELLIESTISDAVRQIAIDTEGETLYWTNDSRGHIHHANLDGSEPGVISLPVNTPVAITLDTQAGKLYWSDYSDRTIRRASLDGSEDEQLIRGRFFAAHRIAFDAQTETVYWTRSVENTSIQRVMFDGTDLDNLPLPLASFPSGLALDQQNGKLYWTNADPAFAHTINRLNLDGSEPEELITGLRFATNVVLDTRAGKLYWTDLTSENSKIQRANLDGSEQEDLLVLPLDQALSDLAIDTQAAYLYWTNWGSRTIQRAGLDGSNLDTLITLADQNPYNLKLHPASGKMYWTTGTKIQSANLDGSELEDLLTDLPIPRALFLITSDPSSTEAEHTYSSYSLNQSYPNPFLTSTTISYSLSQARHVELRIYDLLGREVETLTEGMQPPGTHTIHWDGHDQAAGVYVVAMTGDQGQREVLTLVKVH